MRINPGAACLYLLFMPLGPALAGPIENRSKYRFDASAAD
jgi:hypothetical protein